MLQELPFLAGTDIFNSQTSNFYSSPGDYFCNLEIFKWTSSFKFDVINLRCLLQKWSKEDNWVKTQLKFIS